MGERSEDKAVEFRTLYDLHAPAILRYAIRCTGRREIAEEIASEAFLKLYENLDRVESARAGGWLTTAVKNLSVDHWRRIELERRESGLLAATAGAAPFPAPFYSEFEELIGHPSLKPEHRVCLSLHYKHGLANKEITSHTGLTENQVKSALQYGLKLLRRALGSEAGESTP